MRDTWPEAYDSFAAAATAASAPGAESLLLECLGQMAVLACFGGQVSRAESMANRSVELADSLGLADAERPSAAASALAWVSVERDELRAGSERIAAAQVSGPLRDPVADTLLTVASARLQAASRRRRTAPSPPWTRCPGVSSSTLG